MKNLRLHPAFIVVTTMLLFSLASARAEKIENTIKFSDATKPGTLKIVVLHGDVRVRGADVTEVSVKSDAHAITTAPRQDGLRVLTASSSFALTEKGNTITLDATDEGWSGTPVDLNITVPYATAITLSNSLGGDITCSDVTGDLEIRSLNGGEIRLDNIDGGALVETRNGEIRATVRGLHEGKPLSFMTTNGEVTLKIPAEAKANVRLRTQNGSILTDFDEKALVTKIESVARTSKNRRENTTRKNFSRASSDTGEEIRAAVHEAVQAGAEATREAASAIREAAQAAREAMEEARSAGSDSYAFTIPPPPMPPLPPMTGGKIVSGTLNGGGPEIQIATMNGDVTLRKLDGKK